MTRRHMTSSLAGMVLCLAVATPAMAGPDDSFRYTYTPVPTYSFSTFTMPAVTLRPVSIPNTMLQSPTLAFRSPVLSRPVLPPLAMIRAAGTFRGVQSTLQQTSYWYTYSE